MKRRTLIQIIVVTVLSVLAMFLAPFLILRVRSSDQVGLMATFYYWIDPLLVAAVGIYAGGGLKSRWYLLLIPTALYPLLTWASGLGWSASYLQVSGVFLLVGCIAAGLSYTIRWLRSTGSRKSR